MTELGRDRLRELLDAVLDEDHAGLGEMAAGAFTTPWHFSRQLSRGAGEPPVALRRRVVMERAAWQLQRGSSVTEVAFDSGYDSVEGFSRAFVRAFDYPPKNVQRTTGKATTRGHWLPAPNGIHFHPPMHLWVSEHGQHRGDLQVVAQLLQHDLADTTALIRHAGELTDEEYRRVRLPGLCVLEWDGPEESVAAILDHHVRTKEVWVAAIDGTDFPEQGDDDPDGLLARHEKVGPRWVDAVREIDRLDGWGDRLIDALCEPPESFVLSQVVTHVIHYGTHRRELTRNLLAQAGTEPPAGDPIVWLRSRAATTTGDHTPTAGHATDQTASEEDR